MGYGGGRADGAAVAAAGGGSASGSAGGDIAKVGAEVRDHSVLWVHRSQVLRLGSLRLASLVDIGAPAEAPAATKLLPTLKLGAIVATALAALVAWCSRERFHRARAF